MKKTKERKCKNCRGITLIALVVTIVVLLILAGTTISMLAGENGIIKQSQNAKEATVVAKENETIVLAVTALKTGQKEINEINLKNEIVSIEGKDNVDVTKIGMMLNILFKDTQNTYSIDTTGSIIDTEIKLAVDYEIDEDETIIYLKPTLTDESLQEKYESLEEYEKTILSSNTYEKNKQIFIQNNSVLDIVDGVITEPYTSVEQICTAYFSPYTSIEEIAESEGISKEEWLVDFLCNEFPGFCSIENPDGSIDFCPIGNRAFNGFQAIQTGEYKFKITYLGKTIEKTIVIGEENYWDYIVNDDNTITLTNYRGPATTVVVPSEINGLKATAIGRDDGANIWDENICEEVVWNCGVYSKSERNIEKIILPEGIVTILDNAFQYTENLIEIQIPDTVTSIEARAFYHCKSLFTIDIPSSVTKIGFGAFEGSGLKSIHIPDSVTIIESSAFRSRIELENVKLPEKLTCIDAYTFMNCSSLTSIEIPDSVTDIRGEAFEYCGSLTSINIPNSVTSLGRGAFGYCRSLISINIPDSVTTIDYFTFYNCTSLTEINIEASAVPSTWDANWKGDSTATVNTGVQM